MDDGRVPECAIRDETTGQLISKAEVAEVPYLETLQFRAAPAATDLFDAVTVIRQLNRAGAKTIPAPAPTSFIGRRRARVVRTDEGLDRASYEMCVLSELRNASLRRSLGRFRQNKDFDEYLIPAGNSTPLKHSSVLPEAITRDVDDYLAHELATLHM